MQPELEPTGPDGDALALQGSPRIAALRRRLEAWSFRKVDDLTVETAGLSRNHRTLVRLGYAATALLLIACLASGFLPQGELVFTDREGAHRVQIGLVGIVAATWIVGWAFLLSGASDARRRIFVPLVVVASLWLSGVAPASLSSLVLIAGGVLVLVLVVRRPSSLWLRHPTEELLAWLVVIGAISVAGFLTEANPSDVIRGHYVFAGFVVLVGFPYWLRLGTEAPRAGIDLGRSSADLVRRALPRRLFTAAAAIAVLAWPGIVGLAGSAAEAADEAAGTLLLVSLAAAVPVALWTVARIADGAWSPRNASLAIAVDIGGAALGITLASSLHGTGLLERLLGALQIVPPVVVFAVLAAYDVIHLGSREAEQEGRLVPRSGRVLMYFGALLLVISSLVLLNGVSDVERRPDVFINGAFLIGLLGVGIPAFVRAIRRQPELFLPGATDPTAEAAPAWGRPGTAVRLAWIFLVGWWLSFLAVVLVMYLALSIVGLPWARRIVGRLPAFMALYGRGTSIDVDSRRFMGSPAPFQHPVLVRAFWFVTIGWWLAVVVIAIGYLLVLPVVTIPAAVRLLSRIGAATTLQRSS